MNSQFIRLLIAILGLQSCQPNLKYQETKNLMVTDQLGSNVEMQNWLKPFDDSMSKEMNQVIGFSKHHYQNTRAKQRVSETQEKNAQLSRIVSDWTLDFAQDWAKQWKKPVPEMAILNYNGLRRDLDSGNITKGQIFEIMPFDNEVVILTLSGTQIFELFEFISKIGGSPIAGAEIHFNDTLFVHASIGGNRFDSRRSYTIATIDFLQFGGDGFTMLKPSKSDFKTGKFLRDVMLEKVKEETELWGGVNPRNGSRFHNQSTSQNEPKDPLTPFKK